MTFPAIRVRSDFDDYSVDALCVLLQTSLPVRLNMIQPNHGQSLSQRNSSSATFGYSAQIAACEQEAVAVSKEGPFPSVRLEKIYHRQHALRAQAAKDFAALNSWQVSLTQFPLFALTPKAFRSTGDHKLSADTLWRASSCFISGGQATTPAGSHRRATAPRS